jgi:hypothetical protein
MPHHISTFLTQKPSRILSYIHELSDKFTGRDYTFLFALSANFEHSDELEQVVSTMRSVRSDKGRGKARLVGCLSGPVDNMELTAGKRAALSCAVAVFDSGQCVPFYSELQGRRDTQVGRWHSFRKKATDEEEGLDILEAGGRQSINWEDVWNKRISSSINKDTMMPEALRSTSYVRLFFLLCLHYSRLHRPSEIHTLLYMTTPHPDLFTSALSDFWSSSKSSSTSLGLVAAPTHFVTGRPVTLFSDDKIYGNGSVGLALMKSEDNAEDAPPKITTEFIGMQELGGRMVVTRQG